MTYTFSPAYPTPQHARAAESVTRYFSRQPGVAAVLLTCSCARGKASADSCLDIDILLQPQVSLDGRRLLEKEWAAEAAGQAVYAELQAVGRFSHVDLNITDGKFQPGAHGWTSGPDEFELEIGNLLAYSVPLWVGCGALDELRAAWLPYYAEELRQSRAALVRGFLLNNLEHIPLYAARGLYFQSFNRFYHAFGEFLQALFIQRRTYPIAYDKWVREQVVEILGLPELYAELPHLFELRDFESSEIVGKAARLRELVDEYLPE